jgi:hypothetical protein
MIQACEIVRADYSDAAIRSAIPDLLNIYAKDLLGFQSGIDKKVLDALVPGFKDSFLDPEAGSQLFMSKACL